MIIQKNIKRPTETTNALVSVDNDSLSAYKLNKKRNKEIHDLREKIDRLEKKIEILEHAFSKLRHE